MTAKRTRLGPDESRSVALAAARRLLLERGPQAVTLKAVAAEVGRTHANLLHHFGSAAGLQAALARSVAERLNASIGEAVDRAQSGDADLREIVDRTFDAFGKDGAGALAAWMILTGNRDALDPVLESLNGLVAQLSEGHGGERIAANTLGLVLSALGDSLLGGAIAEALGMPRDTARELAAERLRYRIADEAGH